MAHQLPDIDSTPLMASGGGGIDAPPGTHLARCCYVIDLGTHFSDVYNKLNQRICLTFELYGEDCQVDGQPMHISRFYSNKLSPRADFRKDLDAWRGRAFTPEELKGWNVGKVLGVPAMVTIIQEDKGGTLKTLISTITSPPKGTSVPELITEPVFFAFNRDNLLTTKFPENMPSWAMDIIRNSNEYKERHVAGMGSMGDIDEDIPFLSMTCDATRGLHEDVFQVFRNKAL